MRSELALLVGFVAVGSVFLGGCAEGSPNAVPDIDASTPALDADGEGDVQDSSTDGDAFWFTDVDTDQNTFDPDAACALTRAEVETYLLPVDIIWVVDNSVSMKPAIDELTKGLNSFADLIAGTSLDYRVIMLALRSKTSPVTISGSPYYAVCIPPPLAGNENCGNGERFFQSSVNIRSTQPLEQFLGTLGQTNGYEQGKERGGEPWAHWLRPEATKSIVIVTDDDSRLSRYFFEQAGAGTNPNNQSFRLPPGILHKHWEGLFDDYLFHGLYGWGSDDDLGVLCSYSNGTKPPSAGATYTELVLSTGGVRAKICDGATAWTPFFEAVAQAVATTTKIDCEFALPKPEKGELDPDLVNVLILDDDNSFTVGRVNSAADCGVTGGWYYDDRAEPTELFLCEASCSLAQSLVGVEKTGRIELAFGCPAIIW